MYFSYYIYIYRFRTIGLFILGLIWISGYKEFSIPGSMALFFFSSGAYYGIFKIDFTLIFNKYRICYIYPILLLLDIFSKNKICNEYLHRITIIIGIVFFIMITVKVISKHIIKLPTILTASSFFIYAFHEPYYDQFRKVLFKFILPLSQNSFYLDIQMSVYYIVIPIIYTTLLIIIFRFISNYMPQITKILSGGR